MVTLVERKQEAGQEPRQTQVHFPIRKQMREEASQAGREEAERRNGDDHARAQALVLAHRDQFNKKKITHNEVTPPKKIPNLKLPEPNNPQDSQKNLNVFFNF